MTFTTQFVPLRTILAFNAILMFIWKIRVIHGYDKIDDGIIWGTIVRHLPALKVEIERILNSD